MQLEQIFSMKHIVTYLIIINLFTFLAMYLDKEKAKKGKWRISESTLLTLVVLGGGIGGIVGMYLFRHKTQKLRFSVGFPVILIIEIIGFIYFLVKSNV